MKVAGRSGQYPVLSGLPHIGQRHHLGQFDQRGYPVNAVTSVKLINSANALNLINSAKQVNLVNPSH